MTSEECARLATYGSIRGVETILRREHFDVETDTKLYSDGTKSIQLKVNGHCISNTCRSWQLMESFWNGVYTTFYAMIVGE